MARCKDDKDDDDHDDGFSTFSGMNQGNARVAVRILEWLVYACMPKGQ